MRDETWQVERGRLLKSKKNAFIRKTYDKLDALRTLAYEEGHTKWFHRMNEFCIWIGNQQEFKTWHEEVDLPESEANLVSEFRYKR